MTDQTPPPENEITDELKNLGQNLKGLLQTAWESDERRKLQQEIQKGVNEFQKAVSDFETSPTGQKLKSDVQDLGERLRAGEVEAKMRGDLLSALRTLNDALAKATTKKDDGPPPESSSTES
jgi:DNA topoisomerase VI subunit B